MNVIWKRRIAMIGIVIGVYVAFRWILPVAIPFLLAWFLAEVFYPIAMRVERKIKIKKTITGSVLLGLSVILGGGLIFVSLRELLGQINGITQSIPALKIWTENMLNNGCEVLEQTTGINAKVCREYILDKAGIVQNELTAKIIPGIFGGILSGAKGIIFLISGCVVTFISYILLIGEMDLIRKKIREYSFLNGVRRVWDRLKRTSVLFFKAQIIIIAAISTICSAGLWMMKNPYYLLLGIILGIFDAFPIIGTGVFLYPAAVILLFREEYMMAAGCVILDLLTSIVREVLEPILLGKKLGIPSIFVLISVYVGVFLYGAAGVILGPLSFSAMYEIGKELDVWGM